LNRYINLGCGSRINPAWLNVDFSPVDKNVIKVDLLKNFPWEDNSFFAVYSSHVLEHFSRECGRKFLKECYRICQPQGIIRVVVPDLESIVSNYLLQLSKAKQNSPLADLMYDWTMLELLDQVTRSYSGGEMARFIKTAPKELWPQIELRIGKVGFLDILQSNSQRTPIHGNIWKLFSFRGISKLSSLLKTVIFENIAFLIWGKKGRKLSEDVLFYQSGENHKWMYDSYSLTKILKESGFSNIKVQTYDQSQIPNWCDFQLDNNIDGSIYKPDSIYVEAIKDI
jgi:ubiquinone/menaquinone biosynthesis C-methylase UbiE